MAKALKKRALAEFSQVTVEEKAPVKKLKLVYQKKTAAPVLELHATTKTQDAVQIIQKFHREHMPVDPDHVTHFCQTLLQHFYVCDKTVKEIAAELLADLVILPGCDVTQISKDVLSLLKTETSHGVIAVLLRVLVCLGETEPANAELHQKILTETNHLTRDSNHTVRARALSLMGALSPAEYSLLAPHLHDPDPRVRAAALQALLRWHARGLALQRVAYDQACTALSDDFEGVRLAAVKLVWVFCKSTPEATVSVKEKDLQEEIRLVDDGFGKICNMVNDLCMHVRAEALRLLGSLPLVGAKFLEQTLDKKLMSQLRLKKSAHERAKENYESGEWSSGKKWADDAPKENIEVETVSLMASGSTGAFVHGLEDEYMDVRNAAVNSLCALAQQNPGFAQMSQDFLVDMFNDEIEAVRLNAIHSLRRIAHHILLREDQLEVVLGALKDYSYDIREGLHSMLGSVRLATLGALRACLEGLAGDLARYPQDRGSVWAAMRALGRRHAAMVLPIIPDLLRLPAYFSAREERLDDPAYLAVLILVFNAAAQCSTATALFREHIVRHYSYVRDAHADLVPALELAGSVTAPPAGDAGQAARHFLDSTLLRLAEAETREPAYCVRLMESCIADLGRVSAVDQSLAATADCMAMFVRGQLIVQRLIGRDVIGVTSELDSAGHAQVEQVQRLTEHIEQLFVGLSVEELCRVRELRMRAQTLRLLSRLRATNAGPENKGTCIKYLQVINNLSRLLESCDLDPDSFVAALLKKMSDLESCEPTVYVAVLYDSLKHHKPTILHLSNELQRARATVIEPHVTEDQPISFVPGLTASVHLVADIENMENTEDIRIQVRYPDMQVIVSIPRQSDFRHLSASRHRLVTDVILSHGCWTESSTAELTMVKVYTPDRDLQSDKQVASRVTSQVELCAPIKLNLLPKYAGFKNKNSIL